MPTVLGLILIPLSAIWLNRPERLLQLALVAAVFEAAAALILGAFGFPMAMVPGLLFLLYILIQYLIGMRYPGEGIVLWAMLPILLLLGYALISVAVIVDYFAGKVMVSPQKIDPLNVVDLVSLVPLTPTTGNITQILYLAMNVSMAVAVAIYLTRAAISYGAIIKAYLLGGYIAVGIAFWQFASRTGGVPYPDDILYSNPGWAIVTQAIGTVPRIQGSFAEPAALAFYLSGLCFCCLWLCVRGYQVMRPDLLLLLAILAMLLTTSATGLAVLACGLPVVLLFAARNGDLRALRRCASTLGMLALGGAILIGPALIIKPDILDAASSVLTATTSKTDSESYEQRTGLDQAALATVEETAGLGVGWGSFRASSLIPGLLANSGVFGLAMFGWMILSVTRLVRQMAALSAEHRGQVLVDGFTAALCGQIAAALLSAPTIGSLAFFLQLGCVVGTAARIVIESQASHSTWNGTQAPGVTAYGPNRRMTR